MAVSFTNEKILAQVELTLVLSVPSSTYDIRSSYELRFGSEDGEEDNLNYKWLTGERS